MRILRFGLIALNPEHVVTVSPSEKTKDLTVLHLVDGTSLRVQASFEEILYALQPTAMADLDAHAELTVTIQGYR